MVLWRVGGNYNTKTYSVFVAPGAEFPNSNFLDELGNPIQFKVDFTYGKTDDLPSSLAAYLLAKGLAQETRIIL